MAFKRYGRAFRTDAFSFNELRLAPRQERLAAAQ
jgi:hypothetical protein